MVFSLSSPAAYPSSAFASTPLLPFLVLFLAVFLALTRSALQFTPTCAVIPLDEMAWARGHGQRDGGKGHSRPTALLGRTRQNAMSNAARRSPRDEVELSRPENGVDACSDFWLDGSLSLAIGAGPGR